MDPIRERVEIANKLNEWLDDELRPGISPATLYFVLSPEPRISIFMCGWTPIGYMASLQNLCDEREDLNFDSFWGQDSNAEVHHFIGKDIVNFHALFWPRY